MLVFNIVWIHVVIVDGILTVFVFLDNYPFKKNRDLCCVLVANDFIISFVFGKITQDVNDLYIILGNWCKKKRRENIV